MAVTVPAMMRGVRPVSPQVRPAQMPATRLAMPVTACMIPRAAPVWSVGERSTIQARLTPSVSAV
jgi:hypothetical protein